jgi:MoxR-like ATPase
LVKLAVGYPSSEEEREILRQRRQRGKDEVELKKVTNAKEFLAMRKAVEEVYIDPDVEKYIIDLVRRTRNDSQVAVGASPRGSLALLKLTRAWAALEGRDYVLPDDVKTFANPALVHRLILKPDLWLKKNASSEVIEAILDQVAVPVLQDA